METIFTVRSEDLTRLTPEQAVDVFRELLWAEATAVGIGKNLINVPSAITVADGGVDAEVAGEGASSTGGQGIIKPGISRYQIKTGEFSPRRSGDVNEVLFGTRKRGIHLRAKIKSCIESGGTFVVVPFGWDVPDVSEDKVRETFRTRLAEVDPKYASAKIEVWRQNTIRGFFVPYPSLALRVTGRQLARFQTHSSWAEQADMKKAFKAGTQQIEFISSLRTALRRGDQAVHVRVRGEPGIGKTKLVLEATDVDDLRPIVIYCSSSDQFRDSNLMNEILRKDNTFHSILVVDECDSEDSAYIWNLLQHRGPRVKLLTIHTEFERASGSTVFLDAPPLTDELISAIIQEYGVPADQADRWAELCSGYPRVAHVIGLNLRLNPEDLLRSPDTVLVWQRYVAGGDDPDSETVRQRRIVLQHIGLFKRFGFEKPLSDEAKAIADLIQVVDGSITWGRFNEIVRDLRERKILQGHATLYVTPKMLHVWLWSEWWETYGHGFVLEALVSQLPPKLQEWFFEMFAYARESRVASKLVEALLGPGGPFRTSPLLKARLGARFFHALADADPKSALGCLQDTVGNWTIEERLQFTTGRREVIWSLEGIAMWRGLFGGAARLLLALAEAENETWANNASGVFADLFSPAYGRVAPTEASPEERFPVLREAVESSSKPQRLVAIRAANHALESRYFIRSVGTDRQGLRQEPKRWMPETYGELFDSYRRVWQLLRSRLETLPDDERQEVVKILLSRGRELQTFQNLSEMVLETIDDLTHKPYVSHETILRAVLDVLRYDGKNLLPEVRRRWERFRDDLTGSDFPSLLRRYVGMNLPEDQYTDDGKRVSLAKQQIDRLAEQAIENFDLLESELGWLVTDEAKNGYRFGHALGIRDEHFSHLPRLLDAMREKGERGSAFFLAGYFRAIFEKARDVWEDRLDRIAADNQLRAFVPELTGRSGLSDRAALRVLSLAREKAVRPDQFRAFIFGAHTQELSQSVFQQWIEFLVESEDASSLSVALDLMFSYYLRSPEPLLLPEELTLRLLTHETFIKPLADGRHGQMDEYNWRTIAKAFVETYPRRRLEIASVILDHMGEDGTIFEGFYTETFAVLNEITKRDANAVWELASSRLGPPIDSRAFHIEQWLRSGPLLMIPPEAIWHWVDEDVENRAWYAASFVPPTLFRDPERVCLAREVLVRYGSRQDVRRSLLANFGTEGWTGPASLHYQQKMESLLEFSKEEENEDVRHWIDQYVGVLKNKVEQAKIAEEREF